MNEKESRFDDKLPATPPPSPLRASNTLESLKPRSIYCEDRVIDRALDYDIGPRDVYKSSEPFVRKTDKFTEREQAPKLNANVLPVDWPTAAETMGLPKPEPKKFDYSYKPTATLDSRVTKLEEQVDALLDRIAKHNQRAQHRI